MNIREAILAGTLVLGGVYLVGNAMISSSLANSNRGRAQQQYNYFQTRETSISDYISVLAGLSISSAGIYLMDKTRREE